MFWGRVVVHFAMVVIASTVAACGAHREAPPPPVVHTTSAMLPREPEPVEEETIGPPPRDAERVIASLRPKFRACFERGRTEDHPNMTGKIRLVTRVAEDGSVTSTRIAARDGLSRGVAECVARHMTQ